MNRIPNERELEEIRVANNGILLWQGTEWKKKGEEKEKEREKKREREKGGEGTPKGIFTAVVIAL